MTTGSLALIIFFAILVQSVIAALVWLHSRRRQLRRPDSDTGQPQTSPKLKSSKTSLAWDGFQEFVVIRRVMEDSAASVCSLYLAAAERKPLPPYKPGQYLTFKLAIYDPASGRTRTTVRCYSLSDRPRPDYYRVSIRRAVPPSDNPHAPPGLSSNYFHDHVEQGTRLMVRAPSGHFHLLERESHPIVLVAGGIGITPMVSIINTLLESGNLQQIWLYYGVRNGSEHVMKEHLRALAERHPNFHLHVCYSKPGASDAEGVDYQHRGHVDLPLLRATLKLRRYQFYVCGPKPMMESVVPGLEDWGVDSSDIHYESFGPATLNKRENVMAGVQPLTVTFSKSGKRASWNVSADSLLEFAEANGIEVESGCRAGSCGSCQTHIDAGEVQLNQQPDADVEPGYCLLCISIPKGDLTLAI